MLEILLRGLLEWLYGLLLEIWEYFVSAFLDVLNVDFAYLKLHIPVIPAIMQILLAVGWALLIGNLVFQSMKSMMSGLGFEGEDPKLLFTRSFVFAFLLFASPQICALGLNMTARVIDLLGTVDAMDVHLVDEGTFVGLGAAWLLVILANVILMFKVFRFLLEIVERYLVLAFLTICAPLAFGVGGSKNTANIFAGWCRMYASMCFMMVSNIICFKLLFSLLGTAPTGADVFLWIALVFGVVKVARKTDDIITRIGLNPAITGDGLHGRGLVGILAYTVMRTMVVSAVKAAGKSAAAGTARSTANNNGTNNGRVPPVGASPKHGGAGSGRTRDTNTTRSSTMQTRATSVNQRGTAAHPISVIPDDKETVAMNGPAPTTRAAAIAAMQAQNRNSERSSERAASVQASHGRQPSAAAQAKAAMPRNDRQTSGKGFVVSSGTTETGKSVEQRTSHIENGKAHRGMTGTIARSQARFTNPNRATPNQTSHPRTQVGGEIKNGANGASATFGTAQSVSAIAKETRFTQRAASETREARKAVSVKQSGAAQPPAVRSEAPKASSPIMAPQESRAPHPANASIKSTQKSQSFTSVPQEQHATRPTNSSAEATQKRSTSASASQESASTTHKEASTIAGRQVSRSGTAGTAPPAARTASVKKSDRAPRQSARRSDPAKKKKGGDASERTG